MVKAKKKIKKTLISYKEMIKHKKTLFDFDIEEEKNPPKPYIVNSKGFP